MPALEYPMACPARTAALQIAPRKASSGATDGADGLRKLYDLKPSLVLLDVVMPGLDGWQALERIREVSDIPVIMLTSRDSELERVRGLRGGADDYIVKPFSAAELVARVEAVLRRASDARDVRHSCGREGLRPGHRDGRLEGARQRPVRAANRLDVPGL